MSFPNENAFDLIISKYAGGAPFGLIKAIIAVESGFNPSAQNPSDPSYGLMQVMIPTAAQMGFNVTPQELLDPDTNIKIGSKYLGWQVKRYGGDYPSAASAYNAGTAYKQRNGQFSNQGYVNSVMGYFKQYSNSPSIGSSVSSLIPSFVPASILQAVSGLPTVVLLGAAFLILVLMITPKREEVPAYA